MREGLQQFTEGEVVLPAQGIGCTATSDSHLQTVGPLEDGVDIIE